MTTPPTHYISDDTTHSPTEVTTLHAVDVWAVHAQEYKSHRSAMSAKTPKSTFTHVVTHTPTGMRAAEVEHLNTAIAVADALAKNFPGFGEDATWAKEPAELRAKPTLGAEMRKVIAVAAKP